MITENICCNCRFYEGVKGAKGCAPCKANRKMTIWDDSCEKIWLIPEKLTIVKPTGKDRCIDCANFAVGDPCHVCEFIQKPKPLTNADRIRSMTDEELAEFLAKTGDRTGKWSSINTTCPTETCEDCWLSWLKEEVDG